MNMFAQMIGDKVGDVVEGAVKNALGIDEKKKDKNKKKGGVPSIFGGDKGQEKDKGGIFSFGHDKKKEEDKKKNEEGGFFSKIFHKDDDDDQGKQKKSGFHGLFAEGEGGGAMGGAMGGSETGGAEIEGSGGQTVAVTDRDLLDDLLDVAEETSTEN